MIRREVNISLYKWLVQALLINELSFQDTCQWQRRYFAVFPKTDTKAFQVERSSSVIIQFYTSPGQHCFRALKKKCSTVSSILLHKKWPAGYLIPNSSDSTTRFSNWKLYWLVPCVGSVHKTVNLSICRAVLSFEFWIKINVRTVNLTSRIRFTVLTLIFILVTSSSSDLWKEW